MPPRRRQARRRSAPAAPSSGDTLPRWAEGLIARGKLTAEEFRERRRQRREARKADLIRRVPPMVEAEGSEVVAAWADEMLDRDPRLELTEDGGHLPRDPRAPLPHADVLD